MLPSRGYFTTIECPFFSNSLCHRVYCHFQHGKKAFSSSEDKANFVYNNNNLKDGAVNDKCQSRPNSDYNLKNINSNLCQDISSVTTSNKIYLPPQDLPSYNPTPISELKTKKTIIRENKVGQKDAKEVDNNSNQTMTKNFLDFNNSDLANDLAKYLVENNVLQKILTKAINGINDPANESVYKRQLINSNTLEVPQEKGENFNNKNNNKKPPIYESDLQSQKNFSELQSIVNDSTEKDDKSKLLEKYVFIKENDYLTKVVANTELNYIGEIGNTTKSVIYKTAIKKSYSIKRKYERKHKKCPKSRHKSPTKLHKPFNKIVGHKKHKNNNSTCDIQLNNHLSETKNCTEKEKVIEVILISDSEESDAYDEFDKIIESTYGYRESKSSKLDNYKRKKKTETELNEYDEFNEILKALQEERDINCLEAKHNTNKSQIKIDTSTTNWKENSCSQKITTMESALSKDNDLPQPKKRIRVAHKKAQNNTITMKTTEDYLSYMESVRERTRYKCVNPSGEEGYQNWSNVKIAPVLNVSSLMNSKKLLNAKFKSLSSNKH